MTKIKNTHIYLFIKTINDDHKGVYFNFGPENLFCVLYVNFIQRIINKKSLNRKEDNQDAGFLDHICIC
jgi:hypothetical protein